MGDTLQLHDLSIGYGKGKDERVVMDNITASLHSGRLTCLIGNNGAGKSTLLRTISAFQPKIAGRIMLEGRELEEYTRQQLAMRIGVVLTERPSVQNITVFQMAAMGRSPYTGFFGRLSEEDSRIVSDSLRMVGIDHLADRMVGTLSDGERQKMMTAKALAQQTDIIYLDEPTAFLDYGSKVDLLQMLGRLCHDNNKSILLSTHDLELALQIADELWVMTPRGITSGTTRQLADDGTLSAFINGGGVQFDPTTLTIRVVE